MMMIETIKPYGSVNINQVESIWKTNKGFFIKDKYGYWQINEKNYDDLKKRGIKSYE